MKNLLSSLSLHTILSFGLSIGLGIGLVFGLGFGLGCSGTEDHTQKVETAQAGLPNSFFTSQRPNNVKDLVEVKETAKKGDEVTFLARIGGRKNASFVSSLAMMIVADPSLVSCELMSNDADHCATPEDYCCEDPTKLTHSLGTVRFMKNELEAYPFTIEGDHGLETLKYIVVRGVVEDINENGLFIVDANQIWVGDKPSYGNERAGSGE